jgi:hypothetical protein
MVFPTQPTLLPGENAALSRKVYDEPERASAFAGAGGFGVGMVTIQSGGEFNERKGKKAKGNESNFVFICFQ